MCLCLRSRDLDDTEWNFLYSSNLYARIMTQNGLEGDSTYVICNVTRVCLSVSLIGACLGGVVMFVIYVFIQHCQVSAV